MPDLLCCELNSGLVCVGFSLSPRKIQAAPATSQADTTPCPLSLPAPQVLLHPLRWCENSFCPVRHRVGPKLSLLVLVPPALQARDPTPGLLRRLARAIDATWVDDAGENFPIDVRE